MKLAGLVPEAQVDALVPELGALFVFAYHARAVAEREGVEPVGTLTVERLERATVNGQPVEFEGDALLRAVYRWELELA